MENRAIRHRSDAGNTHDRRDAELTGDDSGVAENGSAVAYDCDRSEEKWCPRRIGYCTNQHLARFETAWVCWIRDDPSGARSDAATDCDTRHDGASQRSFGADLIADRPRRRIRNTALEPRWRDASIEIIGELGSLADRVSEVGWRGDIVSQFVGGDTEGKPWIRRPATLCCPTNKFMQDTAGGEVLEHHDVLRPFACD